MLFNSGAFVVFFALFFPLYLVARGNVFARNVLLIIASYVFYGWWDPRFLILVAISTSVDYVAALGAAGRSVRRVDLWKSAAFLLAVTLGSLAFASPRDYWLLGAVLAGMLLAFACLEIIQRSAPQHRRRYWLFLSLFTNLGILAFFKYCNFFVDSIASALAGLHIEIPRMGLEIVLPVGLSFYTFQAISRTIDSYRGKFHPAYSIVNYAAYHAFFPQLVAGPIERAAHLMPQFETVRPLERNMLVTGSLLFLWGLYQKIVVADNLAPFADAVFTDPAAHSGAAVLVGIVAFTLQIYCDFCGYSNMARGLARCLGFDLVPNFRLPYFARSPSEFWQRWHVSLSSWLRDYLYIPLGGNRHGTLLMYRNLMLTMLLGGLWHGASWTFVAWGGFHGGIQVLYRVLRIDSLLERFPPHNARTVLLHVGSWALTLSLVMVGWVLFRASSFENAVQVLTALGSASGYSLETFWPVIAYATPLALVEIYQRVSGNLEPLNAGPFLVRYTATVAILLCLMLFAAEGGRAFIYFDF